MRYFLLFSFIILWANPLVLANATVECKTNEDCKNPGSEFACLPQKTGCKGQESSSTCVIHTCQKVAAQSTVIHPEVNQPTETKPSR